jgi:hypothetical protein
MRHDERLFRLLTRLLSDCRERKSGLDRLPLPIELCPAGTIFEHGIGQFGHASQEKF